MARGKTAFRRKARSYLPATCLFDSGRRFCFQTFDEAGCHRFGQQIGAGAGQYGSGKDDEGWADRHGMALSHHPPFLPRTLFQPVSRPYQLNKLLPPEIGLFTSKRGDLRIRKIGQHGIAAQLLTECRYGSGKCEITTWRASSL